MRSRRFKTLVAALLTVLAMFLGGCSGPSPAGAKEVTIDLVDGKAASIVRIEVGGGSKVTLHITSNKTDRVHVHGYDLEFEVGPDAKVTKEFVADQLGTYEIETHSKGDIIAQLVVR